mgnify:CR=1 FL=1
MGVPEEAHLRASDDAAVHVELRERLRLSKRAHRGRPSVLGQPPDQCFGDLLVVGVGEQPHDLAHRCVDVVAEAPRAVLVVPDWKSPPQLRGPGDGTEELVHEV